MDVKTIGTMENADGEAVQSLFWQLLLGEKRQGKRRETYLQSRSLALQGA